MGGGRVKLTPQAQRHVAESLSAIQDSISALTAELGILNSSPPRPPTQRTTTRPFTVQSVLRPSTIRSINEVSETPQQGEHDGPRLRRKARWLVERVLSESDTEAAGRYEWGARTGLQQQRPPVPALSLGEAVSSRAPSRADSTPPVASAKRPPKRRMWEKMPPTAKLVQGGIDLNVPQGHGHAGQRLPTRLQEPPGSAPSCHAQEHPHQHQRPHAAAACTGEETQRCLTIPAV